MVNKQLLYDYHISLQIYSIMIGQQNQKETSQKIMIILHTAYSQALAQLKQGQLQKGYQSLLNIVQHHYILDSDLQSLRFSALMSLAEISIVREQPLKALSFYWQALGICEKRARHIKQQNIGSALELNEQRADEQFTVLLKMISIIEKMDMKDKLIYFLKRAIAISPNIWRQKLLFKLQHIYQEENKTEALNDLNQLISNKQQLQQVLIKHSQQRFNSSLSQNNQNLPVQILQAIDKKAQYFKKIIIPVTIVKEDSKLKYNLWQHLLTIAYVLLKCQSQRNFNKKKYLHKRYDETNQQWTHFLYSFDLLKTTIQFKVISEDQIQPQIDKTQDFYASIVEDLSLQLLKNQYSKKKSKKNNLLQQYLKSPLTSLKDSKKTSIIQSKFIFSSLNQYYRQIFAKSSFNLDVLSIFREFNAQFFDNLLGKMFVEEQKDSNNKVQMQENDEDDELEASAAQPIGSIDKEKKQKKSLKTMKTEKIAQQAQLNKKMFDYLTGNSSHSGLIFSNVLEMVQILTEKLLVQIKNQQKHTLQSIAVRKILRKNIVKVIQNGQGFFSNLTQYLCIQKANFFQLLVEHIQYLTDKQNNKTQQFKMYQQLKVKQLYQFLIENFSPSVLQIQDLRNISAQQKSFYSTICLGLCKIHSIFGLGVPNQAAFYRDIYIYLKTELQILKTDSTQKINIRKRVTNTIDRQLQRIQKKTQLRATISITDEQEETYSSIQDIFRKDKDISSILILLKLFCNSSEGNKSVKNSQNNVNGQNSDGISGKNYLQAFIKIAEIFFYKIQMNTSKEFNSKLIFLVSDVLQIKAVINDMYDRFMHSSSLKLIDLDFQTYSQAFFYLLKIYLLCADSQNDQNIIRLLFFIAARLIKSQQEDKKYILVPKLIYSFNQLISLRKFKPENIHSIRKRLYSNIIVKNLNYVYNSPIFKIKTQLKSKKKTGIRSRSKSDEQDMQNSQQKQMMQEQDQFEQVRENIYDLIHDIYFYHDKDRQFTPKKIDDVIAYFVYLNRVHHQAFQCQIVQLQNEVSKLIRKCYKVYIQKINEACQYSNQFMNFKYAFQLYLKGNQSQQVLRTVLPILSKQKVISEYYSKRPQMHYFYIQSLFILGKFFEANNIHAESTFQKVDKQDLDKDQKYYLEYLCFNLRSETAWQNLIRVNCNKTYAYFDSLLQQPIEHYKNHFLYTKKLIMTVLQVCPDIKFLVNYANCHMLILNSLKIKQRQYMMVLKNIEKKGNQNKDVKQLQKKYKEGLKRMLISVQNNHKSDVKSRFIKLIQIKSVWMGLEKQISQVQKQQKIVIQLDDDSYSSKVMHRPSKNCEQLIQLTDDARGLLIDLIEQEKQDYVIHLEQDIVMDIYNRLAQYVDFNLEKILQASVNAVLIIGSFQQKQKYIQQAQYYLSELSHVIAIFQDGIFLTSNEKYKLKDSINHIDPQIMSRYQILLQNCSKQTNYWQVQQVLIKNKENTPKKQNLNIKNQAMQIEQKLQNIFESKHEVLVNNIAQKQPFERGGESSLSSQKRSKSQGSVKSNKIIQNRKLIEFDLVKYFLFQLNQKCRQKSFNNYQQIAIVLNSVFFQQSLVKASKIFSQICRVATSLPNYQTKRYKNRRSVTSSLVFWSQMVLKYIRSPQKAFELIRQYYSYKSDQLCSVNMHKQKIGTQKNQTLSDFYRRSIVHSLLKINFFKHLFQILFKQKNKDTLILLAKKLLKLSKIEKDIKNADKIKQKKTKNQMQVEVVQKVTAKNKDQKPLNSKFYYLLLCQCLSKLIDLLRQQSIQKQLDIKYQRTIKQFRNKLRKSQNDPQEENPHLKNLNQFLLEYELKYGKIKMKTIIKKDKEVEDDKKDLETKKQIKIIQPQKSILDLPFEKKPVIEKEIIEKNSQSSQEKARIAVQDEEKNVRQALVKNKKSKKTQEEGPFIIVHSRKRKTDSNKGNKSASKIDPNIPEAEES